MECPSLPGCYSQGETAEEALSIIREAIELTLEDMAVTGESPSTAGPPMVTEVRISGAVSAA